jgi:hypothetical protein
MRSFFLLILTLGSFTTGLQAQQYFTRAGHIAFTSDAPLEKIEAVNKSAVSIIDLETGQMEFAVLIKAFQFEKALMQEHFNENYLESNTFPKAVFKGRIENYTPISLSEDGEYPVSVKGRITIHGVTRELITEGKLLVRNGQLAARSGFELIVADFDIKIPKIVRDNIARTVKVLVEVNYELFDG